MWHKQGYSIDIPDTVLDDIMHERLAPSYRAVALAILKNDHGLRTLGFTLPESAWYGALKRMELAARPGHPLALQLTLLLCWSEATP